MNAALSSHHVSSPEPYGPHPIPVFLLETESRRIQHRDAIPIRLKP